MGHKDEKRWLVVGAAGMLGQDMLARLVDDGRDARGLTQDDADITDAEQCRAAVEGFDVVVNCAAWTAVDDAESHEPAAFAVNAVGAANLARAAAAHGARLVQISTDYVFAGDADQAYAEDGVIAPVSAYGRTKAAGEWATLSASPDHLVVRTAWLYGAGGRCFPRTIARVAAERGAVSVVSDQIGQPTWTVDVADLVVRLVDAGAPGGVAHATSSGQASWYEFAQAVVEAAGQDPAVVSPTSSADYASAAPRPAWSVLGHDGLAAAGVEAIGDWRQRWALAAPSVLAAG